MRLGLPLPHFLVLGTQKGGTTSLHHLLNRHLDIFLPDIKEVHFFSQNYNKGLDWYANHYLESSPGQLRGDITPFYLFHQQCPFRIKNTLPNCLLIALLRDPVDRTLSQYFHACRNGYESLDLESALEAEADRLEGTDSIIVQNNGNNYSYQKHSYLSRSKYDEQLRRYKGLFKRRQLLVLKSEDLFNNPSMVWHDLLVFLGVNQTTFTGPLSKLNPGRGEAKSVSMKLRKKIREKLDYTYKWIEREYGITWDH